MSFVWYGCLKDVFSMLWMSQDISVTSFWDYTKWCKVRSGYIFRHAEVCLDQVCVLCTFTVLTMFLFLKWGGGVVCQNLQTILSRVSRSVLTKSC